MDSLREILDLETTHYQDEFSPAPALPDLDTDTNGSKRGGRNRVPEAAAARVYDIDGKPVYVSEPFLASCTATAPATSLPYHWFEFAQLLLDAASDDLQNTDQISNLLRDIREVRQAKLRRGYAAITDGSEGVRLDGVGAMEISESRGFIMGVMSGLRMVGGSREQARRDAAAEERENRARREEEDEDEDME